MSEDDDSDGEGITASQAVVREKDKLLAVRRFILSDPKLYGRVLQYQPLPLAELQASLKAAGIRLGAAKLLDFLDSQCITFSTAKQGQNTFSRRKQRRKVVPSGPGDAAGRGRKKAAKPHVSVAWRKLYKVLLGKILADRFLWIEWILLRFSTFAMNIKCYKTQLNIC